MMGPDIIMEYLRRIVAEAQAAELDAAIYEGNSINEK